MARFLAALVLCSGALYVTAQDQAGLCPLTAPSSSSSGSKSCSADSGCPSNQKCCTYNSNMRCIDPGVYM
ncbi:hypothetical protein V1264_006028 [Littorina saxatilis]|uniref:WAP domain-containing protein n=1 Tax=Littorina saxatilis TaxID=31220 RepID=A0AAN9G415_9CAEN